ncbi:MAG: hypothetical protein JRJ39_15745, partial [Deltaproteobacteria bacterium]|nr:hypothetical protein [Deltaproteobacteria bacterium]
TEIKILRKLFTEEEASMYLDLTMQLATPESVAERTNRGPQETAELLEKMAKKGLIFRLRREGVVRYGASPDMALLHL